MADDEQLASLLLEGAIDEVLGELQTGKEASLYVVRRGDEVIAAKVYKDRDRRTFKNNALYREGRKTRNTRDERALARRSRHGKATQEAAWKAAESETLEALHAAGVRVPRPIAFHDGVVLMELVTDARGQPAPRLIDVDLDRAAAKDLHAILVGEIVKMLLAGWIHGDLSPYNVLLAARGPVIIDFPQAVSAAHNNQARELLCRDVRNVTDFFAGLDPSLAALRDAGRDIWTRYDRNELAADFALGAPDPEDELAAQIEVAKKMSFRDARARGRSASTPPPPAKPAAPRKRAGLWDSIADQMGLGER